MPEFFQSLGIVNLAWFVLAGLLLNLTPGPDVLYIVAQGARGGVRAGAAAALGVVAGCFVHIFAAAFGLSALIGASANAFALLKWLGAAYLVWLGWSMLWSNNATKLVAGSADATGATGRKSLNKIALRGFWTNALNPKVALFFLAFLPQFIAPAAEHKTLAFLALGLVFNLNSLWINLGFGWLGAASAKALRLAANGSGTRAWGDFQTLGAWLARAAGGLFIGFGLKLALMDNPTR